MFTIFHLVMVVWPLTLSLWRPSSDHLEAAGFAVLFLDMPLLLLTSIIPGLENFFKKPFVDAIFFSIFGTAMYFGAGFFIGAGMEWIGKHIFTKKS